MTRDEAIKVIKSTDKHYDTWEEIWVDRLVAVGVLKLDEPKSAMDEPKSAMDKLEKAMNDYRGYHSHGLFFDIKHALAMANLKIVEK